MQSLWTSLSALKSSLGWLDRVSNNIANQDTVGFAADKGSFADAYTVAMNGSPSVNSEAGRKTPSGWWGGSGVIQNIQEKDFSPMPLQRTDNPLDLGIQGDAFFLVQGPNGQVNFTKAGNFMWSKDQNGQFVLATQSGQVVLDTNGRSIAAPANSTSNTLNVGPDGLVSINGIPTNQRIALAQVAMPEAKLASVGNNQFALNPGANYQIINRANSTSASSTIQQGTLAMSNVDATVEMTDLIQAQRMFDLNSEAVQLTNRMMGDANNIRQ